MDVVLEVVAASLFWRGVAILRGLWRWVGGIRGCEAEHGGRSDRAARGRGRGEGRVFPVGQFSVL